MAMLLNDNFLEKFFPPESESLFLITLRSPPCDVLILAGCRQIIKCIGYWIVINMIENNKAERGDWN